ncbi:TM2 domain-containing protein [Arthrobacter sp. B0490]|uniref:TM2 domain-containing protein n=1 Tax=Arthrobacter sp. B0490 TaxID=2058891 RepID=UPI0011B04F4B|nr:TM2 domain-containing protein [Arthrobacter sp. B0490]
MSSPATGPEGQSDGQEPAAEARDGNPYDPGQDAPGGSEKGAPPGTAQVGDIPSSPRPPVTGPSTPPAGEDPYSQRQPPTSQAERSPARTPYSQGQYPPMNSGQAAYGQAPHAQSPPTERGYNQDGYPQGGYPQGGYGQPYVPQKSRVIAGVLGILVGSLGIHRFYLGYTTIGVVLILLSTVGVFFTFGLSAIAAGIWGLVEGILILVGSGQFRTDAHGVPLKD